MHPAADHVMPGDRVGLGPLVLVVREPQVDAAGVHVHVLAEVVQQHRRALGVPAGEAGRPTAPARSARRPPGALFHSAQSAWNRFPASTLPPVREPGCRSVSRFPGQLAVAGERARVEVHRAVTVGVGVPALDQPGDHVEHQLDRLRSPRLVRRPGECSARPGRRGTRPRSAGRSRSTGRPSARAWASILSSPARIALGVVGQVAHVGDVLAHGHLQSRAAAPPAGSGPTAGRSAGCPRARTGTRSGRSYTSAAPPVRLRTGPRPAASACHKA